MMNPVNGANSLYGQGDDTHRTAARERDRVRRITSEAALRLPYPLVMRFDPVSVLSGRGVVPGSTTLTTERAQGGP